MLDREFPADESDDSHMVDNGEDDAGLSVEPQRRKSRGRSTGSPFSECLEGEDEIDMRLPRAKLNRPRSESLMLIEGGRRDLSTSDVWARSSLIKKHLKPGTRTYRVALLPRRVVGRELGQRAFWRRRQGEGRD